MRRDSRIADRDWTPRGARETHYPLLITALSGGILRREMCAYKPDEA